MKRIITLLALCIVCASRSFAVEPPPMFSTGSFSAGPYAGITYGSVTTDPSTDGWSSAMGISAGLDARYYLCETSNLQLGVRYEQRGSAQSTSSAFSSTDYKEMRNYLSFDVTAAWYFAEMCDGGFRPRLYGGVFLGSFMSGTSKVTTTIGGGSPQTSETDIKSDNVNALNWGPKIGVGFDWKMGPGALTFGVSYDYAISNIDNTGAATKFYDRGISAGIGYQFGF
ncbi:MAG: PorT family protein [Bacteroidetes bacterium]|nr:PorT family protein [Bacteroidota bacterium]